MDRSELAALRKSVKATKETFAEHMGLPLRTYEDLEAGRTALRPVHEIAANFAYKEILQPHDASAGDILVSAVVDRDGTPVGGGGETLLKPDEDGVETIRAEQAEFEHHGFNVENAYWWARNSGEPFRLHKWWVKRRSAQ